MRIDPEALAFLKAEVLKHAPGACVYLFGSRLDDQARGGDIDVLVLSLEKLTLEQRALIKANFFQHFGEQKLDLVNFRFDEADAFKDLILLNAKEI